MISLDRTSQSYLLLDRHHMFIHKEGIHMKEMKAQLLVKLLWASIQSIHPETTFCPILKHQFNMVIGLKIDSFLEWNFCSKYELEGLQVQYLIITHHGICGKQSNLLNFCCFISAFPWVEITIKMAEIKNHRQKFALEMLPRNRPGASEEGQGKLSCHLGLVKSLFNLKTANSNACPPGKPMH